MKYIADLHIHSLFSRATSKASNLFGLAAWARIKGIHVLGTGDFTHPGWFRQLKDHLTPAEPGFYRLKHEKTRSWTDIFSAIKLSPHTFAAEASECRFVLTAEISNIYKRHGKVRKIHNILFVPDFESAEKINIRLAAIGNIESDGRPILGLDSRNLLEILLENAPGGFLVPAHIWTPWFSLFGSKSGFDAIEECFGDLTDYIFALETGLSSDPDMNRLISALDRFTLISNSDCHSPSKLGREANLFNTDFDYFSMVDALKNPDDGSFLGTVEFYPEEGKYHYDGHRKCKICLSPEETRKLEGICPICERPLTIGVTHRLMELADRKTPYYLNHRISFHSIIPLPEVLGEIIGLGPATKGVMTQYNKLIALFGSEYHLLMHTPIEEINHQYSSLLGEAIQRIRSGNVIRSAGYDGEFGVIKVFAEGELAKLAGQNSLFGNKKTPGKKKKKENTLILPKKQPSKIQRRERNHKKGLNSEQITAVNSNERHLIITAGPGTGKTLTLIARLARLLKRDRINPAQITAITFTNRAAEEVRARLLTEVSVEAEEVFVGTFHSFCLHWLKTDNPDLAVAGGDAREIILNNIYPDLTTSEFKKLQKEIAACFDTLATTQMKPSEQLSDGTEIRRYLDELRLHNRIDLDEIIPTFVRRLTTEPDFYQLVSSAVEHLFIDEFQDLNFSQYELVKIFAPRSQIFAIGDPDQAIYGFRGSRPEFFYRFIDEFNAKALTLTRNYRSAPTILEAAGAVISRNGSIDRKKLVSQRPHSAQIEIYHAATPKGEAEFIVQRIEELMGGISHFSINSGRGGEHREGEGKGFGDIAVLYRLSKQAATLGGALEKRGIPFEVVDMPPFYMQPSVRPVYYWIRTASGQADNTEYLSLLKYINGIGKKTLQKLEQELMFSNQNFLESLTTTILPSKSKDQIEKIHVALEMYSEHAEKEGLAAAFKGILDWIAVDSNQPDILRFLDLTATFGKDLTGFSSYLKKNSQATVYDEQAETVSLMTLHAAKGLEFPIVFITGVEEKLLPCDIFKKNINNRKVPGETIEEERRLFYVGITRAKEELILTSSATRTIFGEQYQQKKSRFIEEIPVHLVRNVDRSIKRKKKTTAAQMTLF